MTSDKSLEHSIYLQMLFSPVNLFKRIVLQITWRKWEYKKYRGTNHALHWAKDRLAEAWVKPRKNAVLWDLIPHRIAFHFETNCNWCVNPNDNTLVNVTAKTTIESDKRVRCMWNQNATMSLSFRIRVKEAVLKAFSPTLNLHG